MPQKNLRTALLFVITSLLVHTAADAEDYYFRPTEIAAFQAWVHDLSFVVSNPGDQPILLKVSSITRGTLRASFKKSCALKVEPRELFLMPGKSERIYLSYAPATNLGQEQEFEILVEQQPVLFVRPGGQPAPRTMKVRNYIALVRARPNGTQTPMYAENLTVDTSEARANSISDTVLPNIAN